MHFNSFSEDVNQSIPIVLPITTEKKEQLTGCDEIALWYNSKPVAILRKPSFYPHRKEERVCRQFGTSHPNHPYIKVNMLLTCMILNLIHLFLFIIIEHNCFINFNRLFMKVVIG